MQSTQDFLQLTPQQKAHTIVRSDSGFGADYNIDYVLDSGFHILTKGYGGKRSLRLLKEVQPTDWIDLGNNRWVTQAVNPPSYIRPVQYLLLRWLSEGGLIKHSTVICSVMEWSLPEVIAYYDDRGSCETEIQADKGGLKLCKRRKMRLDAQEALILLTDLAHNLLAWALEWMFPAGLLTTFGTTRLLEDVFAVTGMLTFDERDRLLEIGLNREHPYSEAVLDGLHRLLDHFEYP